MKMNKEKYKNLILYLCQKCANKNNFGKTLLYKLLYFCDFDWEHISNVYLINTFNNNFLMTKI